jgi:glycosyltransferase involved in cell wall biosynthesis
MNILFVHQNFPGQYRHLAPALAAHSGNRVLALRVGEDQSWLGVQVLGYQPKPDASVKTHPWLIDLHTKLIRAEAAARRAWTLKQEGFSPDFIIAHPGWGESLLLREIWPNARIGLYCEFFYNPHGADVGFDPEFPPIGDALDDAGRLRLKNANQLLAFEDAHSGLSPTEWQRSTYPTRLHDRISVIHDGIDTELLRPDPSVSMNLNRQLKLTRQDQIITFVNRNLEPYRGYHVFMRALPELLRRRPKARVILVGGDGVSYGAAAPKGKTWRSIFLDEVRDQIDTARVHFVGKLAYRDFVQMLQLSRVHVYLTYPFVLSWSLLESMSVGAAIVASNTAPVREVIADNKTGLLTDFFDQQGLVDRVCDLLDSPEHAAGLGKAARELAVSRYDLNRICLPAQLRWVSQLAGG